MKKLVIVLIMTLMMCGCADTTELGDRAIVQLAAIDHEDGEYTLNVLLFSAGGSSGELDVTKTNVIKVTGRGETLGEAVQSLSLIDGKDIYMSEAKLLVLGGGFEEADIPSVLTMLYRDMRCSLNMPVCCADTAEMLTDLEFTEGITAAEKPVSMIDNAYHLGISPKATLLDVLSAHEEGSPTLIPSFGETVNGSGMTKDKSGKTAELNGSRVISGGRLGSFADKSTTVGAMLLSGEADSIQLSLVTDGSELTCEAYDIKAELKNGRPQVSAHYRSRSGKALSQEQEKQAEEQLLAAVSAGKEFMLVI
ncbi:MAG: hypothetical protein E7478_01595 [Ruminococcaceae bacterium]|nr:hypothetical protein [Oscillospiraceae bacterium]